MAKKRQNFSMVFCGTMTQVESEIKTIWPLEKMTTVYGRASRGSSSLEDSLKLQGINIGAWLEREKLMTTVKGKQFFLKTKVSKKPLRGYFQFVKFYESMTVINIEQCSRLLLETRPCFYLA